MANPAQTVKRYRGRHVFDTLAARKFEGNIGSAGAGNTYYVDGINGSDGNNGRYASNPLKTVNAAIGKCTSGHDDYIIVMDCWDQDTFPITVNKQRLHILGLSLPNFMYPKMNPTTDAAVFRLVSAGAYSEIAGFDISGGDAHGCIDIYGTEGAWIHDCWFGSEGAGGTPLHGIWIQQNPQYSRIEDCRFFGDLGSAGGLITSNGIEVDASVNMVRGVEVLNCKFNGLAIAMNLDNADYWLVENNRFIIPNAQNGEAITCQSDCLDSTFIDNLAVYGMLSNGYTYNPYRDLATNTVNNWARNYQGNAIVEPVGV